MTLNLILFLHLLIYILTGSWCEAAAPDLQKHVSESGEDRLDLSYSKTHGPPSRVILKPLLSPAFSAGHSRNSWIHNTAFS